MSLIENKEFEDVDEIIGTTGPYPEGIVFLGCGGDLNEWINGITDALKPVKFKPERLWYRLETTGGRIDLVMPLPPGAPTTKLAPWKFKFGDCSWWSDYRVNYRQHHEEMPTT